LSTWQIYNKKQEQANALSFIHFYVGRTQLKPFIAYLSSSTTNLPLRSMCLFCIKKDFMKPALRGLI